MNKETEPYKVAFNFLISKNEIEVVYTFTGEYSSGRGLSRPIFQVAVFNDTTQRGKPMGTYWGLINKSNAIRYVNDYLNLNSGGEKVK